MAKIKVMALGGLDERGKNLYLIEIDNSIFIFDVGLKLPQREMLGIDVIIPKFTYLVENKNRIKAIFISKPADSTFGALPYLLKELSKEKDNKLSIPIYCSDLTKFMIDQKLKLFRFMNTTMIQFNVIDINKRIYFDDINVFVEAFKTTSSIPGSLGFAIHSCKDSWTKIAKDKNLVQGDNTIVYTGDYIFDGKDNNDFTMNMNSIARIRSSNKENKILLMISESSYASRKDFTAPNHKIQSLIESVIKESTGRIVFACYDQDLFRINEILQAIQETYSERTVAIHGNTLHEILKAIYETNINKAKDPVNIKCFNVTFNMNDPDTNKIRIINLDQVVNNSNSVVIVTGTGERLFAKMNKIASGIDEKLTLVKNDTIVLATPPLPGNELAHAAVLDELARTDAKTISISDKQAWNVNASYEDIKLLVNMLEPKYFLAVNGLYKDFNAARMAAIEAGVLHNNALIQDNGDIVTFENGSLVNNSSYNQYNNKLNEKKDNNVVATGDVYVDGIGVGDIGAFVIEERARLMKDGVLITGLTINRKTKEIISLIDAQMRGVIYLTNNENMLKSIQTIIINVIEKYQKNPNFNSSEVKNKIKSELQDFIKKETGKMPMILPVINEI